MEINDNRLFDFMQDVRGSLSRLEEGQINTTKHLEAVSEKANVIRAELGAHKESQDAHGIAAAGKKMSSIVSWLGFALAALSLYSKDK